MSFHVVWPMDGSAPVCMVDGVPYAMHLVAGAASEVWLTDEAVVDGMHVRHERPGPVRSRPRFEFMPFGPVLAESFRMRRCPVELGPVRPADNGALGRLSLAR